MGRELQRLRRRKSILAQLGEISDRASDTLVIHYSCESFYDRNDGRSPRITSIAVRNLGSGQTNSFSIHQVAEENKIPLNKINDQYDDLELKMLGRFYEFVKTHQNFTWMHWNMRDMNYGFPAIEHRYRVLCGEPMQIDEGRKFDLARALVAIYGVHYIGHPRLESLITKNKITDRDFLSGKNEAEAFENKQFVKLHQSTLRKVDTLSNIFERAASSSLKTNSSWWEQRGYTPVAVAELIKEHWLITFLSAIVILMTIAVRFFDLYERFFGGGK